jgi:hypothetical protein
MDLHCIKLIQAMIVNSKSSISKQIKILVKCWIDKLDIEVNESLKVSYLKLLLYNMKQSPTLEASLQPPFHRHPPDGPLPRLPPHMTLKLSSIRIKTTSTGHDSHDSHDSHSSNHNRRQLTVRVADAVKITASDTSDIAVYRHRMQLGQRRSGSTLEHLTTISRSELEIQILELTATVETQRGRIAHLESELRIQEGLRRRGEERQTELHKVELKQINKERVREVQRAAMEAVRHPAELLLDERMKMVAGSLEAEAEEYSNNTNTSDSTNLAFDTFADNDVEADDTAFLEYLDQFTLRSEALSLS